MNAAPPLSATWVGNPQIFPSPTAEPAAAMIKPTLEFQVPLDCEAVSDKLAPRYIHLFTIIDSHSSLPERLWMKNPKRVPTSLED